MPDTHASLKVKNTLLRLLQGDITEIQVDAIVNAANSSLMGGGGVDGAIHRRGGPAILAACKTIRRNNYPDGLPTGQAVITTGGELPAQYVIHTVGPVWRGGTTNEPMLLADAYRNSLELAHQNKLRTVAFPSISTGVYGFPIEKAAPIALQTTRDFVQQHPDAFEEVRFVLFSQHDFETYQQALPALG
ncbi:MAG TPA: O-acetyl-ADP-ribose deacetylase [Rhodothermales bacterium]|nr:O-acetyl-ADP-ribose deacetylase [Rhodothermales bacterium]